MFDGSEHFYPAFREAVMRLASLKGGLVLFNRRLSPLWAPVARAIPAREVTHAWMIEVQR